MKIAGFTFIRNAIINDYPITEAVKSILPICDEFVIAHGDSEDGTLELLKNIGSPKIKIVQTKWDENLREGGTVFAKETDKAYQAISKDVDWAFYIQGDECVHEKYLPIIRKEMEDALNNTNIEGLLFHYKHFYGSYDYFAQSRRWYRREIRVLRHLDGIHAYRDAQGFRLKGQKIHAKLIDAYIYHYGWVKPPKGLTNKIRNFNKFYDNEAWIKENIPLESDEFNYGNADQLFLFQGDHPDVMKDRVQHSNWKFSFDPTKTKTPFRRKALAIIEKYFGIRLFEYRNYKKIN